MASLSVRKIDDRMYEKLRLRAEKSGRSMEEEARQILYRAVSAPDDLGQLARDCFGEGSDVTLEPLPRAPHEPLDFDR